MVGGGRRWSGEVGFGWVHVSVGVWLGVVGVGQGWLKVTEVVVDRWRSF